MELHSGPKIANSTCGKTIVAGTIDRGSTVFLAMVQIMFHTCCLVCSVIGIINTNLHILANLPRQKESLAPTK